jgi:ribonuclease H2 subunit B
VPCTPLLHQECIRPCVRSQRLNRSLPPHLPPDARAEITPDIVVYRFSAVKLVEYLRVKVFRIATSDVMDVSKTLIRGLAKDGLMEEGKEDLLQRESIVSGELTYGSLISRDRGSHPSRLQSDCPLRPARCKSAASSIIRVRFNFLQYTSYSCPLISFKLLDDYMKCIEDEKAALALANADKKASEKKKKANAQAATSDTKKRKPQTKSSQGIEKLKKVNVSGMAKMSSFFKKA